MNIVFEVEFTVQGQDAQALANAALSRLEQLNGGPLPAATPGTPGHPPTLRDVRPAILDGAGTICMWQADVQYALIREVEYG